jgi:2-methylcitrate dehydratase PrpD
LVDAVILGYDIGVRVVRACGGKFRVRDTHNLTSDMFYAYGVAAGSAFLLGLGPDRICHAFALTSFQSVGLNALYSESRHISKSFCNGQFAFAGLSAALMAQTGLEGNEDIFGAKQGLLDAWGVDCSREAITAGLGERFEIMQSNFKFFNAGYPVHTPIEATMTLVAEHGLTAEQIARLRIGMPDNARRVVDNRATHNICVQDMVAASIVLGGIRLLDQPFPEVLSNADFRRLRTLIDVVTDPGIDAENPDGRGAYVTLETVDGKTWTRKVDSPRGHSTRGGASWSDLEGKWSNSLPGCDVGRAFLAARALDETDDIRCFAHAFTGEMC